MAKVGLYLGSRFLSETSTLPYTFLVSVESGLDGVAQLVARATDTVGAESDSPPVEIRFQSGATLNPRGHLTSRIAGNTLELTITEVVNGDRIQIQGSTDLKTWTTLANLVAAFPEVRYTDTAFLENRFRFYRTVLNP